MCQVLRISRVCACSPCGSCPPSERVPPPPGGHPEELPDGAVQRKSRCNPPGCPQAALVRGKASPWRDGAVEAPGGPALPLEPQAERHPILNSASPRSVGLEDKPVLVSPKPADRLSWEEKQGHGDFGSSFSQLLSPGVNVFIHKLEMKGSSQGCAEMK